MSNTLTELINENLQQKNYLISDEGTKFAVIYFTSNGLYGFDEIDLFKKNIIERNKFEFYGTRIKNSKNIFVRDITNNWYVNGINNEINSFEKLLEFFKKETEGYKVITIGSSAGGYASVLFGNLLGAERIFAFSAQFVLPETVSEREYKNITDMVHNSTIPTYYSFPQNVDFDVVQYDYVKNASCLKALPMKSHVHGVPLYKKILERIINLDEEKLNKIYTGTLYNEKVLVIKFFGFFAFISRLISKNFDCYRKKLKRN